MSVCMDLFMSLLKFAMILNVVLLRYSVVCVVDSSNHVVFMLAVFDPIEEHVRKGRVHSGWIILTL